jgi:hypothetical protein
MKGYKVKENGALQWIQTPLAVRKLNVSSTLKRDQVTGTYKHDNKSFDTNSLGIVLNYLRPI